MEDSSFWNLSLRSAIIWTLIFILMSSVPATKLPMPTIFITATLVIVLYVMIEYIVLNLGKSTGLCNTICGIPMANDKYVQEAIEKLKLSEQAGPAVKPVASSVPVQVPVAPAVALAPSVTSVPLAPSTSAPLAPSTSQPVVPSVVPTAAPVTPTPSVVPVQAPATREGFRNVGIY